jgi:hypothetical protein
VEVVVQVIEVVVTVAGGLVLLCMALALLEALVELVDRTLARWRAPEPPSPPEPLPILRPRPRLTLLVRYGERTGLLRPSVQVREAREPREGSIRLELVDERERVRLSLRRPFPAGAFSGELPLPAFVPPPGTTAEEALSWHWDVIVENCDDEPFRWREHPRSAEGLNAEAELECPVT